jgi:hypothetical protein
MCGVSSVSIWVSMRKPWSKEADPSRVDALQLINTDVSATGVSGFRLSASKCRITIVTAGAVEPRLPGHSQAGFSTSGPPRAPLAGYAASCARVGDDCVTPNPPKV